MDYKYFLEKVTRPAVKQAIAAGNVTPDEWEKLHKDAGGLNTYEKLALIPAMTDELLAQQVAYITENCATPHHYVEPITYDQVLVLYALEATKRLRRGSPQWFCTNCGHIEYSWKWLFGKCPHCHGTDYTEVHCAVFQGEVIEE